jgi:hypothetical protein
MDCRAEIPRTLRIQVLVFKSHSNNLKGGETMSRFAQGPTISGFWKEREWCCLGCNYKKNKFKWRECRNCGEDPDPVVMGIQNLTAGDANGEHGAKLQLYERGFQIDPANIVLKLRLHDQPQFPDYMYPTKAAEVKKFFGPIAEKEWFDMKVKWEGWVQSRFGGFLTADEVKIEAASPWNCGFCTFENDALSGVCGMCGQKKAAAHVAAANFDLPAMMAQPEVKEDISLDPTVREIRKLCKALGIPIEKALHFEDLYDKCIVHKEVVPSAGKCAEEGLRKLKNLRFDAALLSLEQGANAVQKFMKKADLKHQAADGFVVVGEDGKYAEPPALIRQHSGEVGVSEMYKWVLRSVTLEHSVSAEALSFLADVRQRYEIPDADHIKLLGEIGLSEETFKSYVERGASARLAKKECVVCMEGLSTHVILDCMHLSVCEACVPLVKADKNCPQCRTKFSHIKKVF